MTISEDLDEVRRLGRRRSAAGTWALSGPEEFGARNGVPGELLVRLRAEKVIAVRDIAN